jgi:peptidoglycan/LPS O-acetylase OafA/YrhL
VYWTLERELRFYGLVLLLLVLGLRRYTVHALLIAVAVQTVDAASHVVPHWISDLLNAHWAHLFACGTLLARSRHAPSWKTLGFLGLCLASSRLIGAVPFTYGAGAVGLVWIATHPFVGARLRPLVLLGKISYPLYLAHQYIGYAVMRALYARGAPPSVAIASACAVAFAIAIALHFLVEEPCLQLQRRAFPITLARPPRAPTALSRPQIREPNRQRFERLALHDRFAVPCAHNAVPGAIEAQHLERSDERIDEPHVTDPFPGVDGKLLAPIDGSG